MDTSASELASQQTDLLLAEATQAVCDRLPLGPSWSCPEIWYHQGKPHSPAWFSTLLMGRMVEAQGLQVAIPVLLVKN